MFFPSVCGMLSNSNGVRARARRVELVILSFNLCVFQPSLPGTLSERLRWRSVCTVSVSSIRIEK